MFFSGINPGVGQILSQQKKPDRSTVMKWYVKVGTQHISRQDWTDMCRQAEREYPDECCGAFLEKLPAEEGPLEWKPCRNIQNDMHAKVPAFFPRKADTAFVMDPTDWFPMQQRINRKEVRLAILYHSHVDAPAYFSDEDYRQAIWDDQPKFPEAVYLVLSVIKGQLEHWRAFQWAESSKKFVLIDEGPGDDTDAFSEIGLL